MSMQFGKKYIPGRFFCMWGKLYTDFDFRGK